LIYVNFQYDGLAVCGKLAYDSLNASRLIEWLESVKLLGASKVFLYTNNLNTNASKVVDFYKRSGLVQAAHFDIPELGNVSRRKRVKRLLVTGHT